MKLARAELFRRRGSLARPVRNAVQGWSHRESLLLRVEDADGHSAWGEASPLPGFGHASDTAEHGQEVLASLLPTLELARFDEGASAEATLRRTLAPFEELLRPVPSARFALECALLLLLAHREGRSLASLLARRPPRAEAHTAAMLDAALRPEALGEAAQQLFSEGVRAVKCKVGSSLEEDLARLDALEFARRAGLTVRLDANGACEPLHAEALLRAAGRAGVEFVEEPSREPLALEVGMAPLALDESLLAAPALRRRALCYAGGVRVAVLKPTLYGGLLAALEVAREAWSCGLRVVWSHALEGPLALACLAELALLEDGPTLAAGLDPHAALAAWPSCALPTLARRGRVRDVPRVGVGISEETLRSLLHG